MENIHVETSLDSYGLPLYKCKKCQKTYSNKTPMLYHIMKHTNEYPFKCGKCNKGFINKMQLTCHTERVHDKKIQEKCFVCERWFYDKKGLRKHLKVHDISNGTGPTYIPEHLVPDLKKVGRVFLNDIFVEVNFVCSVCSKIFTTVHAKQTHEERHNDSKSHESFMESMFFERAQKLTDMPSLIISLHSDVEYKKVPFPGFDKNNMSLSNGKKTDEQGIDQKLVQQETELSLPRIEERKLEFGQINSNQLSSVLVKDNNKEEQNGKLIEHCQTKDPINNDFFFRCKKCLGKFVSTKTLTNHVCMKQEDSEFGSLDNLACQENKENWENGVKQDVQNYQDSLLSKNSNELKCQKSAKEEVLRKDLCIKEGAVDKEKKYTQNFNDLFAQEKYEYKQKEKLNLKSFNRDSVINDFYFGCQKCLSKFVSNKALTKHVCKKIENLNSFSPAKRAHTETDKNYKCSKEQVVKNNSNRNELRFQVELDARYISADKPCPKNLTAIKVQPENHVKPSFYQFHCTICTKGFLTRVLLEEHMNTHSKDIPCQHPGRDCKETFYKEEELWSHMLSVHNHKYEPGQKVIFKCIHCQYRNIRINVKRHMNKHTDLKRCVCLQCGKMLKNMKILKNHMMNHNSPLDFSCQSCEKSFVSKGKLNGHIEKTHNKQSVVCPDCGKFLTSPLAEHMTVHTGEKKFKCREGCPKTFRLHGTRGLHERSHRGVKKFKCKICPKEFMQSVSLRNHIRHHEGRKDYKCQTCGKDFVEPRKARNCKHNTRQLDKEVMST